MTPDLTAAVDAAARAWFDRGQAQRRDADRFDEHGKPWTFEALTPLNQHALRVLVLPIVAAAFETHTCPPDDPEPDESAA